jgi:acetyl-CoA carboxylase beta subunit
LLFGFHSCVSAIQQVDDLNDYLFFKWLELDSRKFVIARVNADFRHGSIGSAAKSY